MNQLHLAEQKISTWPRIRLCLVLIIIGFLVYWNAIAHPFVHDDVVLIRNNPSIAQWNSVDNVFFQSAWNSGQSGVNTYYRPLVEIYNRALFKLFGFNPFGFHLGNILLHIINSILVFLILEGLFKRRGVAFTASLFFLIHPVQTQAVACVSGASNILYVFLMLLSFGFYILVRRRKPAYSNVALYILSLSFFMLAVFAKEQAIILPGLLILYEFSFCCPHEEPRMRKVVQISGYIILAVGYMLFRQQVAGAAITQPLILDQEFWLRIATIPKQLLTYGRIILFPFDLHYYRSLNILEPFALSSVMFAIVVIGITVFVYRLKEKDGILATFGVSWSLITILPTLNIVPLIIEYSYISTAEHFLYLSSVGAFLLLIIVGKRIIPDRVRPVLLLVLFLVLSLMTILQNRYWRSEVALFERTVQFEKIGRVHVLLGKAHYAQKNFKEALHNLYIAQKMFEEYILKVENHPSKTFYMGFLKGIHFDTAHVYEGLGENQKAVNQYKQALKVDPGDLVVMNNLGAAYIKLGQFAQAANVFQQILREDSKHVMAMSNLAYCYIFMERKVEAQALYRQLLNIYPGYPPAMQNLRLLEQE